jgi:hypothetical protein
MYKLDMEPGNTATGYVAWGYSKPDMQPWEYSKLDTSGYVAEIQQLHM